MKTKNNEKIYPHPYFPIGSIYFSVVDTNPSIWFGGTWEQIAKGRTLVGVDTSDTDFNTVKKTGGEKKHTLTVAEMPKHKHSLAYGPNINGEDLGWDFSLTTAAASSATSGRGWSGNLGTKAEGNGQAHNNMPPYFTCYIWCRTA